MENTHHWGPIRDEDFLESDVWDVMEESSVATEPEPTSIGLLSKQLQSSARLIPTAKNPTHEPRLVQHSAPVNIPNWSRIHDNTPKGNSSFDTMNNDDEDVPDCRLPPHEWLARKQKRSQISSFSVCEGVGRTLKGRDLSKVRHAVLTKTGFI